MTELLLPARDGVQVHASSLLPLRGGGFLVAWFEGPHEGHPDSRVRVLRRPATGTDATTTILPEDPQPQWNPVLAEAPDGDVWLFFRRGERIDNWTTWVSVSRDSGRSWAVPFELVAGDSSGGRGPVRQAPVRAGGLWVAGGSVEDWEAGRWDCFVDVSADSGATWQRRMVPLDHLAVTGAGCIQPWIVPGVRSRWVMLTRSTAGSVFRAVAQDPTDWGELVPTDLPNNNSGIAAIALPDGRLACIHNAAAGDWGARSRLLLSTSADDGRTWRPGPVLVSGADTDDGAPSTAGATGVVTSGRGEFSYPSAVLVDDEVWVTYSWERRSIAMTRIPLADVLGP